MSGRAGDGPTRPPQPTQVAGVCSRMARRALASPPGLRRHSQAPSGAALSSSGRRLATTTNELWRITEGYRSTAKSYTDSGQSNWGARGPGSDHGPVVEVVIVVVARPQPPDQHDGAGDDRREADQRHVVAGDRQQAGEEEQHEAEHDAEEAHHRVLRDARQWRGRRRDVPLLFLFLFLVVLEVGAEGVEALDQGRLGPVGAAAVVLRRL